MRITDIIRKSGVGFAYPNMKVLPEKDADKDNVNVQSETKQESIADEYEEEMDM